MTLTCATVGQLPLGDCAFESLGSGEQQLLRFFRFAQLYCAVDQFLNCRPDDVTDWFARFDLQQVLQGGEEGDLLRRIANLQQAKRSVRRDVTL